MRFKRSACLAVVWAILAATLAVPVAAQNVVTNGDFEGPWLAGSINGWIGTGWTQWKGSGASAAAFWGMPNNNGTQAPGNDYQRLIGGNIQSSKIDQGIVQAVPTAPGTQYDLAFDGAYTFILWGGDWDPWTTGADFGYDLTGQTSNPAAASIIWQPIRMVDAYDHYTARFTATGATTSIWIRSQDTSGQRTQLVDVDNFVVEPATQSLINIIETLELKAVRITQLNPTTFKVEWTTDVASDSKVEYDTVAPGKGAEEGIIAYANSKSDPALVTEHSITLTGLALDTTYHLRVVSSAPGYATRYSYDQVVRTPPVPLDNFTNGSFEDVYTPDPNKPDKKEPNNWVKFGVTDGAHGPLPDAGAASWYGTKAIDGDYFIGSGGSFVTKNGGYWQHIKATPGKVYSAKVKYKNYTAGGNPADQPDLTQIGIDPTGGVNPDAPSVVWNYGVDLLQAPTGPYSEVTVDAQAQSDAVTIFVRFVQKWGESFSITAADLVEVELPEYEASSIGDARAQQDGANITFTAGTGLVCTLSPISEYGYFYMEDEDGTGGIRVNFDGTLPQVGDKLEVTGKLSTNADGERVLTNATVNVVGTGTVPVWTVSNKSIGGAGYVGAEAGLVNQGLLVKVFGKVTEFDFINGFFLLDDGSGVNAGGGKLGIKVKKAEVFPNIGDYVSIIGVVTSEIVDGQKVRVVRGREGTIPSDFVIF